MWVLFLHVCLCTTCMTVACEGQQRALNLLELELQIFVNHCVSAGNKTQVLYVASASLKLIL